MKSKQNRSEWARLLAECISRKADKVPPGWKNREYLEVELRAAPATITRRLRALEKAELVEKRFFRIVLKDGRALRIPHWKPKA
jgi:hypothetical protein